VCGVSSLELPRVLHVSLQQMWVVPTATYFSRWINALPASERTSYSQLACGLHPPSGSRYQHEPLSDLQLVCRGLQRRPSVCLPIRCSLYATILPEVDTETVVKEGRDGPWKGSVSTPSTIRVYARSGRIISGGTNLACRGAILTTKARRSRRKMTEIPRLFFPHFFGVWQSH
jgi:hypothetical protein